MKILLTVHGWPGHGPPGEPSGEVAGARPGQTATTAGGTERVARRSALALAEAGAEVIVFTGSLARAPVPGNGSDGVGGGEARLTRWKDGPLTIVSVQRPDLFFDHWQKSRSVPVAERFVELLREERPAVLLVHHWIRLTRDLVFLAAREGIPAVVFLHDHWTSCLRVFRVRPDGPDPCPEPLGSGCIACASTLTPRTPWVSIENGHMAFATHRSGVERELSLARSLVVPSAAHREGLLAGLSAAPGPERWHVLPPPPPEAKSPARSNPRPLPGTGSPLLLGSWGHMSPHKGTDLLLEALRLVAERCSVELHLAGAPGDAAFEAELLSLAAGLAVHFHGPFEPEDLPAHPVTAVHALVYPSRAPESHGLVLDEARALGLPAVLPRLGAFPERAREDPEGCDGVLFHAPGDAADLARVLCRLADEEGLIARLGKGTRTFVASTGAGITEGAWARRLWELCAAAAEEGAPETVEPDWFDVPMAREGERLWDAALSRTPPEELAP